MKLWQKFAHLSKILVKQLFKFYENLANLFVNLCDFIYNKNMKRFLMILLSFIFLGGAVSSSAFFINNGLQVTETNRGGNSQPLKMKI